MDSQPGPTADDSMDGILMVRVVEAHNIIADSLSMPYAVIEFDKAEFVAESSGIFHGQFKVFS